MRALEALACMLRRNDAGRHGDDDHAQRLERRLEGAVGGEPAVEQVRRGEREGEPAREAARAALEDLVLVCLDVFFRGELV